jgi:hypothetical protein
VDALVKDNLQSLAVMASINHSWTEMLDKQMAAVLPIARNNLISLSTVAQSLYRCRVDNALRDKMSTGVYYLKEEQKDFTVAQS